MVILLISFSHCTVMDTVELGPVPASPLHGPGCWSCIHSVWVQSNSCSHQTSGVRQTLPQLWFFLFQSNLHKELPSEDKNHHSDAAVSQQGRTARAPACPRLRDAQVRPVSFLSLYSCTCTHMHARVHTLL